MSTILRPSEDDRSQLDRFGAAQMSWVNRRPDEEESAVQTGMAATRAALDEATDGRRPLPDEASKRVLEEFFRGYDPSLGREVIKLDGQKALEIISLMADFDKRLALALNREGHTGLATQHACRPRSVCAQAQDCLASELAETREERLREARLLPRRGESLSRAPHELWRSLKLTVQEQRALLFGPPLIVCTSWTRGRLTGRLASGSIAGEVALQGNPAVLDYEALLATIAGEHVYLLSEQGATIIHREGDEIVHPGIPETCEVTNVVAGQDLSGGTVAAVLDLAMVAQYQRLLSPLGLSSIGDLYYGARTVCIPLLAALSGSPDTLPLAAAQLTMLREHAWLEFSGISGSWGSPRLFWFNCWHEKRVLFSPGDPARQEPDIIRFFDEQKGTLSFDAVIACDCAVALTKRIKTWYKAEGYFHQLIHPRKDGMEIPELIAVIASRQGKELLAAGLDYETAWSDRVLHIEKVSANWKEIEAAMIALVQCELSA